MGLPRIATLDKPQGVAIDPSGNLLIADTRSNRVRVVAESTGTFYGQSMNAGFIYTVAGGGTGGIGNGIPATSAALGFANGVTVDGSGNLVIATSKQRVRVVAETTGTFYGQAMTAGDIYTVAGSGGTGFSGDGGKATKAHVYDPESVIVDRPGNLVIADTGNNRIRVVAASHRHVLRPGHDRRRHLHRGRRWHRRPRRRRPGHQRRARPAPGRPPWTPRATW